MSEKVTLTVFKDSPHIWGGELEGTELAIWLMGKANAILNLEKHTQLMVKTRDFLAELQSSENLRRRYATLGLSLKELDPIHPLSTEAIQFDKDIGDDFRRLIQSLQTPVTPTPPPGYSLLPDLAGELAAFQQKKADQFGVASTSCEQTTDE